jgi:hypothetical protein
MSLLYMYICTLLIDIENVENELENNHKQIQLYIDIRLLCKFL